MQGDADQQEELPGMPAGKPGKTVLQGSRMAGGNAVAAKGTGKSGLTGRNILWIQGVVLAFGGAGHAFGATVLFDGQAQGIYEATQVDNGANGTIFGTMDHAAFRPG